MFRLLGVSGGTGKNVEKVRGFARGCGSKRLVPGLEEGAQVVAESLEFGQADLGGGQLVRGQRADLPAGRAALVALPKDDRQFREREAEGERPPDQKDAVERDVRVDPVIVLRSDRRGQDAHALVVPQRVSADRGAASEFA